MTSLAAPRPWFRSTDSALWFALIVSGGLLAGAYVFEYGFGYIPCNMCWWQRYVHFAIAGLAALGLILRRPGVFRWFVLGGFCVSAGIALWHSGVEYGLLPEPKSCTTGGGFGGQLDVDPDDPLAFLDGRTVAPSCGKAVWHFLGLSMAAWNALISLIAAGWIATLRAR